MGDTTDTEEGPGRDVIDAEDEEPNGGTVTTEQLALGTLREVEEEEPGRDAMDTKQEEPTGGIISIQESAIEELASRTSTAMKQK